MACETFVDMNFRKSITVVIEQANTIIEEYEFGTTECWELDALGPTVIADLIRAEVDDLIDQTAWKAAKVEEERNRSRLMWIVNNWNSVESAAGHIGKRPSTRWMGGEVPGRYALCEPFESLGDLTEFPSISDRVPEP